MASEAQKRAVRKYDQNNTKSLNLKFNKKTDADIIEWLWGKENKQGYIKNLLRQNIK